MSLLDGLKVAKAYGMSVIEFERALQSLHDGFDDAICEDTDYGQCMIATPSRWTCEYCNGLNPDELYRCDHCYAPREDESGD